jgi:hypothetical protein
VIAGLCQAKPKESRLSLILIRLLKYLNPESEWTLGLHIRLRRRLFFDSIPQHMRPKTVLSPPEASQRADKLRDELFASWDHLKKIVLAHEETIQKRWKKTATSRD